MFFVSVAYKIAPQEGAMKWIDIDNRIMAQVSGHGESGVYSYFLRINDGEIISGTKLDETHAIDRVLQLIRVLDLGCYITAVVRDEY